MFRGAELPRLLTMVVMLGVLALLIGRASNPSTWTWLAPDVKGERAVAPDLAATHENIAAPEPAANGPTDEDAEERESAREEFQAVGDKVPLGKEEMPAYWRLMSWEEHQSTRSLFERSTKDVTFKQLWQDPQKWRGKLVQIPVHLRRTEKVSDVADNPVGLTTVYEVWGWNSDSQPYWYWMVCPRLPPQMPSGGDIYEEATFVGYFLKLLPYEDHQGKTLATPLLIGRLVWHPGADNPLATSDEWTWPWIVGGGLVALFIARWGLRLGQGRTASDVAKLPTSTDEHQVDAWLEGAGNNDSDRVGGPVNLSYGNPDEVMRAIAKEHGLAFIDLDDIFIPPGIVELVPESVARRTPFCRWPRKTVR